MPYVVISPFVVNIDGLGSMRRVAVEVKTLLFIAKVVDDGGGLFKRPVAREARLDLGEDAQSVEGGRLKVLDGDVFQWWPVIAGYD